MAADGLAAGQKTAPTWIQGKDLEAEARRGSVYNEPPRARVLGRAASPRTNNRAVPKTARIIERIGGLIVKSSMVKTSTAGVNKADSGFGGGGLVEPSRAFGKTGWE
jgi:hypothetical protein